VTRPLVIATALALLALPAAGESALPLDLPATATPVIDCLRDNLPAHSLQRDFRLRVDTPLGPASILAHSYWLRGDGESRLRVRVEAPSRVARASLLMIWDHLRTQVFVYSPASRRTRKIPAHQLGYTLFGSEIRFVDLGLYARILESGLNERLPDTRVTGRSAYAIQTFPPPGTGYGRIRSYVDRESCVPLRMDFFGDHDDALEARVETDPRTILRVGGLAFARDIDLLDYRSDDRLRMRVERVSIDPELPSRIFDAGHLAALP
jgi:hypothetical protein